VGGGNGSPAWPGDVGVHVAEPGAGEPGDGDRLQCVAGGDQEGLEAPKPAARVADARNCRRREGVTRGEEGIDWSRLKGLQFSISAFA
jgi:hypothetical protein